jgi:hypothetical protein
VPDAVPIWANVPAVPALSGARSILYEVASVTVLQPSVSEPAVTLLKARFVGAAVGAGAVVVRDVFVEYGPSPPSFVARTRYQYVVPAASAASA